MEPDQHTTLRMTPTEHEKHEWSRFATAAYACNRNDIGHRYSMAATLRQGESMDFRRFHALQDAYRAWLCFNEYPPLVQS